jgi:hypothetical protein
MQVRRMMKLLKIILYVLISFLCFYCSKSFDPVPKFEKEFQILDLDGNFKTRFTSNDTMLFKYILRNNTGKDLTIGTIHSGPFVQFLIQKDTTIVKDSFYGFAFPQPAISYAFPKNETIEQNWKVATSEFIPEIYTAKAIPQIYIEDEGVPPVMTKNFNIY